MKKKRKIAYCDSVDPYVGCDRKCKHVINLEPDVSYGGYMQKESCPYYGRPVRSGYYMPRLQRMLRRFNK